MKPSRTRTLAALLAAAAVAAFAGAASAQNTQPPSATQRDSSSPAAQPRPASGGGYPWTVADAQFMSNMIGHHAQAVVMSRMAPSHGASPALLTLAGRIINAQQDEIATMQQWLRDRNLPVPDTHPGMMMMNGMQHEMLMPGMLTQAQMAELDHARGADFDRLFLTYMIQHHRGAVTMVHDLFESQGAAQDEVVFKFASDVNVDQTTEIGRMQRMLTALLFGGEQPPP